MSRYTLKVNDHDYTAEVKELTAEKALIQVDGVDYTVDLVDFGKRPEAPTVRPPAGPPEKTAETPPPRRHNPRTSASSAGTVTAPLPGLVLQLKVKEGEAVDAGQAVVDERDELRRRDPDAAQQFIPFRRRFRLYHLLQTHALIDQRLDPVTGLRQHAVIFLQTGPVAERAVPGDDFRFRVGEFQALFHRGDRALQGAAAVEVDERIQPVEKDVAHVQLTEVDFDVLGYFFRQTDDFHF